MEQIVFKMFAIYCWVWVESNFVDFFKNYEGVFVKYDLDIIEKALGYWGSYLTKIVVWMG